MGESDSGRWQRCPRRDSPESLSIYGTLFLTGSVAAARSADRATARAFLAEADEAASHVGADANRMWTAFGPTNVSIHRVATAAELGDVELAIDLGRRICTRDLPVGRRVRHAMEVARAYSSMNRTEEAVPLLLDAERLAPEQVRRHSLSRQLVLRCTRQGERSSPRLAGPARRLKIV